MNSFFSLKPEEVTPVPRETARYLGYPYGVTPEKSVLEMIETMTNELQKVLRPKVVYEEFDCDVLFDDSEKAIVHIADFSIASNDLAKNLRDCNKVIMFAATIGRDVDLMIQKYQKIDALKAGALQAAGAMFAESLVDSFNEKIKTDAATSGRKAHPRYSPGYGDVSLEVQKLFFKYLDCNKIGLTLMDTLIMAPEKSVTAFIGIEEELTMRDIRKLLGKQILFFDGGTGTVLQSWGLKPGELSEEWNFSHKEKIVELHYNYFKAGANIVKTNTFSANVLKFPLNFGKVIRAGIENANEARAKIESESDNKNHFIAFDFTSTGKLLKPLGDLDFEDAIRIFRKSFDVAIQCDIDLILIETMNDGYETKACVIAAKEAMEADGVDLPIFVTNVYDEDCRTLSGSTPESMVAMLEGLGVDALGVNCSLGPVQMLECVKRLCACASVPVIVNPNAGLPKVVDGQTVFDVKPADFVDAMKAIRDCGASVLGGCCGTTPEYIKQLTVDNGELKIDFGVERNYKGGVVLQSEELSTLNSQFSIVSSNTKVVRFGEGLPPVLIGERINPTGKKKFKEALRNKDIPYIIQQGLEQEEKGADVLDVNVGLPEIDEKEMMTSVMTELQSVTDLPLQIDTSSADVMEAALRRYNGKALVNSVNGKQEIMDAVFPIVKKYGGVVVALTLDENGIPETSEGRIAIAKKIYAEAEKYGIAKKDILIDPLAMAISSDTNAAKATLETVKAISEMGGNTSLGVSNISFGLPNREIVTSAFFTMAMENGLKAAIMNPLSVEMMKAYRAFCLLKGYDENCENYIKFATPNEVPLSTQVSMSLSECIIKGLKSDAATETKKLLATTDPLEIINNHLIPGLDFVGKRFEEKTMFLPQLLMAAEAAASAFAEIREAIASSGKQAEKKGKFIIATVKGDIHDIGKNIVKVLLENYDFDVIDLGKDVPPEKIVEACKRDHVPIVGLSALMTTTVPAMEETIKQLRAECPWAKVCVGGAVLTQEYADMIGADFYGKDAMATVKWALEVIK